MPSRIDTARAAQGVGIIAAGFASGAIFSFSHVGMALLPLAPLSVRVAQWELLFWRGLKTGPPAAVVSFVASAWAAYVQPAQRNLILAAGALPLLIFPFTSLLIVPINNEIFQRKERLDKLDTAEAIVEAARPPGQTTQDLLDQWRARNYVRSTLPMMGALLGAWTALVA